MQNQTPTRLGRVRRYAGHWILALVAGLAATTAWSSQIVAIEGKTVVTPAPVSTTKSPGTSTHPASGSGKPAPRPASAPKR
jgi:hypothetical protein